MIGWWRPMAFALSWITPVASSPSIFGHLHVREDEIALPLMDGVVFGEQHSRRGRTTHNRVKTSLVFSDLLFV
jgi:hypothetical protein